MSQLFDPEAARQWLVEAFTEYDDARNLDGASHEQAMETTAAGYPPGSWPGHRLPSKRQAEIRRAAGRQLRGETGPEHARALGSLLRCLAGQQRADAAAATLYPEDIEENTQ